MDHNILNEVIKPCIAETSLQTAMKCLIDIMTRRARDTPDGKLLWLPCDTLDTGMLTLVKLCINMLWRMDPIEEQPQAMDLLEKFEGLCERALFK